MSTGVIVMLVFGWLAIGAWLLRLAAPLTRVTRAYLRDIAAERDEILEDRYIRKHPEPGEDQPRARRPYTTYPATARDRYEERVRRYEDD
jgi:hypothetical protein